MTLDPFIFLVIVIIIYYCLDKFWHYLIFNFTLAVITIGISNFVNIPAVNIPGSSVSYTFWYQLILGIMVLVGFAKCFKMLKEKTTADKTELIE